MTNFETFRASPDWADNAAQHYLGSEQEQQDYDQWCADALEAHQLREVGL